MRRHPASTGWQPVDVALSDPDAAAPEDPPDAVDRSPVARRRPWRVLTRTWWVVVLVVAVAAAAAVDAVGEQREARRLAELAQMPGVATSLEHPLEEIWRAEGVLTGHLDDVAFVHDPGADGSMRAVDTATGHSLWTRPLSPEVDEWCRRTVVGATTPRALTTCVATATSEGEAGGGDRVTVSAVDGTTGATTASLPVDQPVLDVAVVEGDVVVLTRRTDGRMGALRWGVDDDEVRWRMTSSDRLRGDEPIVEWYRHVVFVRASMWMAVDLRTGREIPTPYVDDFRWLDTKTQPLGAGRTVEWQDAADSAVVQPTSRVRGASGELLYSVPGRPWLPAVDDGSARPALVVATSGGQTTLRAVDVATGDGLWTRRIGPEGRPAFVVDGRLVAVQRGSAVALDAASGEVLWTQSSDDEFQPVTDGRYVLLRRERGGVTLAAHRLDDGTTAWELQPPLGTVEVTTVDGHVVAIGDRWLAGLGAARG